MVLFLFRNTSALYQNTVPISSFWCSDIVDVVAATSNTHARGRNDSRSRGRNQRNNRGRGLYQYKNRATSQPHFNEGTGKIFCKSVIEWATQHFNVIIALIMHMHPTMARSQMHYMHHTHMLLHLTLLRYGTPILELPITSLLSSQSLFSLQLQCQRYSESWEWRRFEYLSCWSFLIY